ncbi:MBL fold metallo-hydrolase [Thiomonas bhubaneswarensis]|uniref:Glyoxylase or a related metal-dependent hydrolase, beta-lactamase superfamily II n=1 Tax=Thiomonas bhubaneswarensis TaxID=339866 RepID=A0A0K6HWZ5_9BURK|nr:MBL fold metallo-hydrolase [Thiomonas bhubaneswarensis]CUA95552.1 Glyoxylase or a related metal-dependent hydrolase, beta-lactamase superfamily II [Thiomonas bhubaneswarensis]
MPPPAAADALIYPFGDAKPEPGESVELAPGLRWLRMGLPFALNHINLWLLEDCIDGVQGWTVVDCGIDSAPTRAAWEQVFATQLDGRPILRVVVTHMHPDHVGLAHWLTARWNCLLWMSATDYAVSCMASRGCMTIGGEPMAAHFAAHGLADADTLAAIRRRTDYYTGLVPAMPSRFKRLQDGDVLRIGGRNWRCVAGFGHAPEHISLHCEADALFIAGDMLLPRISTNVSVNDNEPLANPLQQFLDSLARFAELLPDATLVFPSHGLPFRGARARIAQLQQHHRERLAEVVFACATPQTAADLLPVLFKRPLDVHQMTFAMGESIAHLHKLWFDGQLRRLVDDGVYRFVR